MFNFNNSRLRENNVYFFGIAGKINENDIDIEIIKKVKLLFLKDICGMKDIQKRLLKKQLKIQKKQLCHFQINFVLIDTN